MKKFILSICVGIIVILFTPACKKDKETVVTEQGNWEGKYSTTRLIGTDTVFTEEKNNYAMILQAGGKAEVFDGLLTSTTKATGTYTLAGDELIVGYKFGSSTDVLSIRATMNTSRTAVKGKWFYSNGRTGGTFYMFKK